ncbi:hypothetical protein F4X33_01520 [Candidatus Poribacteria bacterium]|nr:hypothetical protein [Candidatus Poribacteria bacterium]
MFKFSFNRRLASVCLVVTSVGILLVIIGGYPIGSQNDRSQDSDGQFNVPARVKEMPEKEEVTIANPKDDKGLRSERLPQLQEM